MNQGSAAAVTSSPDLADTRRQWAVIGVVGFVHMISHVHLLLLPPLYILMREDTGLSFLQLGFAVSVHGAVSTVLQTPMGFIVDRYKAAPTLLFGLLLAALAIAAAAFAPSYWLFLVAFGFAGVANTIYHPADFQLLASQLDERRRPMGYALHTFTGHLGFALSPLLMLGAAALWGGWQGGLVAGALLGVLGALSVLLGWRILQKKPIMTGEGGARPVSNRALFLDPRILTSLFIFIAFALITGGVQGYMVPTLQATQGGSFEMATLALSSFLGAAAIGVLAGGFAIPRLSERAILIAGLGLAATIMLALGFLPIGFPLAVGVAALAGFAMGLVMPLRDLMVGKVAPPGAAGRVFGFVSTGFNIGQMIAPIVFGALLDSGQIWLILPLLAAIALSGLLMSLWQVRP